MQKSHPRAMPGPSPGPSPARRAAPLEVGIPTSLPTDLAPEVGTPTSLSTQGRNSDFAPRPRPRPKPSPGHFFGKCHHLSPHVIVSSASAYFFVSATRRRFSVISHRFRDVCDRCHRFCDRCHRFCDSQPADAAWNQAPVQGAAERGVLPTELRRVSLFL